MKRAIAICIAMLTGLSAVDTADESSPAIRRIKLPDHGYLDLPAPSAWLVKAERPLAFVAPTISFDPPEGNAFSVLITVIRNVNGDPKFNDAKSVSNAVAKARDMAVKSATTRHIPILELKGDQLTGYYFTATDRAPKPGEWRYMTHGSAALLDLLLTFTVFSNDPQQPEAAQALAMLQKASHVEP